MSNYYADRLNTNNLQQCYEIAPKRVKQFLEAEIDFVLSRINPNDKVLDLGCGYGRVAIRLIDKAYQVVGIDISHANIQLANQLYKRGESIRYFQMDAVNLTFQNDSYDLTICIQNGISAFKVDPIDLIKEALRVTKRGGLVLLSSYSEKFWEERLNWFKIQADQGLIGEINLGLSHDGVIVCHDGFKAITYSGEALLELSSNFNVDAKVVEVDNSSVFCEMKKK